MLLLEIIKNNNNFAIINKYNECPNIEFYMFNGKYKTKDKINQLKCVDYFLENSNLTKLKLLKLMDDTFRIENLKDLIYKRKKKRKTITN